VTDAPANPPPPPSRPHRPTRNQLYLAGAALVIAFLLGWIISTAVGGGSSSGSEGAVAASRTPAPGSSHDDSDDDSGSSTPVTDPDAGLTPTGPAVPKPAALPAGLVPAAPTPPFTCPPATVTVSSAEELYKALAGAGPGDSIHLADGVYQEGDSEFTATARGTAAKPIYLCGGKGAVLQGQGYKADYALHFDGAAYWRADGFTVRFGQKGVMVDAGTHLALQNLTVNDIGDEAVHLRKNSTANVVRGLTVYNTGNRRDKFGEGIYVGSAQSNWGTITGGQPDRSNGNFVLDNVISQTTAESVDIKEGTTGGVVAGNTFDGARLTGADSWVDVKGNGWLIAGNAGRTSPKDGFQTHVVVAGWGNDNTFADNVADLDGGSGVGYYLHEQLSNKVDCNNKTAGAAGGLSNDPCAR
jgi:hypothetical protein